MIKGARKSSSFLADILDERGLLIFEHFRRIKKVSSFGTADDISCFSDFLKVFETSLPNPLKFPFESFHNHEGPRDSFLVQSSPDLPKKSLAN